MKIFMYNYTFFRYVAGGVSILGNFCLWITWKSIKHMHIDKYPSFPYPFPEKSLAQRHFTAAQKS